MPAKSKAQQGFFGAELARARAGEATDTGLPPDKLREFAATPAKGLPPHVKPKHKKHHFPPKHGGRSAKPRGGMPY